jgi:hypothetical protein
MGKKHSHSQDEATTKRPLAGTEDDLLGSLRTLHAQILARRGGRPIAIDRLMEEMRAERDAELMGIACPPQPSPPEPETS